MNENHEPTRDSQCHHGLTARTIVVFLLHLPGVALPSLRLSIGSSPLPRCLYCRLLILFPSLCDIVRQWIIGIRSPKKCLYRKENCTNLEGRRPITYSSISFDNKANSR